VVFSAMHQLHPRYLEAITPAIGAAVGISLATLVSAARRGRAEALVLAAGVVLSSIYLVWASTRGPGTAVLGVVGSGLAAVAFIASGGVRAAGARGLLGVGVALALVSMFVPPASRSLALVHHHSTDAGHIGDMPARRTAALSAYLGPRTKGARYEVVSSSFSKVAPLIVRDGRPVLIATGVQHRPLISLRTLRGHVTAGRVRYALFGEFCGRAHGRRLLHCSPQERWLRSHSTDVSSQVGSPPGTLFRLHG
jgi:4-amino-4-deoxy-L-arabinose transferase-like glycosyltransferase